ncbi:MAG TPA: HAMP domain-containing sensor histidine kinase [Verrucomicrobiae bacterium]|nr:HAMP domain-containing sensor histidine kinase [Verrucomicrobiae bacterium]
MSEVITNLEMADKLQKDFINIAAHELRTPIQTITGLIFLLKTKKENILGKEDEMIDVISRNADRLQKLTENILYKTKIDSQGVKLSKEKFDINEKIDMFVKDLSHQNNTNNDIEILSILSEDSIVVNADKIRVYELLSNLLNNAIKFTRYGKIIISSYIDDFSLNSRKSVVVKISDTGIGIHNDLLPMLFTPLITSSSFGTGLGLFICKSIVEAHGGKIWAENNSDGMGATFYFLLPL